MGLLDWLISDTQTPTGVGGNPMSQYDPMGAGNPMAGAAPALAQPPVPSPAPAPQDPASSAPAPAPGPDDGSTASPVTGPVPMPMARPAGLGQPAPSPTPMAPPGGGSPMPQALPQGMPQGVADANNGPMPAPQMAPTSLQPGGAGGAPSGGNLSVLGRALGLDPNRDKQVRGALAAGMTAAGNSAGKSPAQALFGGAGAAMTGGNKAEDKTTADQSKYLNDAIKAQQAGDTSALNVARTKLALAQAQAAGKDTKTSVMNTKEQLYLRGIGAVNQDARVKASAASLKALATTDGTDSPAYKQAVQAHNQLIETTKKTVLGTLGVDEKSATDIAKKPGFSSDNPVPKEEMTQQKFNELPNGAYFINPKDGRLLIKQPQSAQPGGGSPEAGAQSPTPAAPAPVTTPAGSAADNED